MHAESCGQRGMLILFDEVQEWIAHTYVCFAAKHTYVIDTYCGPDSMQEVTELIRELASQQPVVVVNTHFHWDHIWGNCAFPESRIIAHGRCRELMEMHWDKQLKENETFQFGQVIKHLPTEVFQNRWEDPDDHVSLVHTPGHTEDSITFFDHEDGIVFVGDNLEAPLPYIESPDLDAYIATLESYRSLKDVYMISSHAQNTDRDLLLDNLNYLKKLRAGEALYFIDPYAQQIHHTNLAYLKAQACSFH
ncbi:MAG TPA: MBL fold metallo-hydrolase [Bacteroidales bacterium]|nr:MBL fold metallo-hydrolase [Bacteroidales bacterium]